MSRRGPLSEWFEDIHVIGAGGIGNALVARLARQGATSMHIWDPDIVEEDNLGYQHAYRDSDRGMLKIAALTDYLMRQEDFDAEIIPHNEVVGANHGRRLSGIVFGCVDSMQARMDIWAAVKSNHRVLCYIDGRTGGPLLERFRVEPNRQNQIDFYEGFLFTDEEALDLPCGTRDDCESAGIVAALMARSAARFVSTYDSDKRDPKTVLRTLMDIDEEASTTTRLGDVTPQNPYQSTR